MPGTLINSGNNSVNKSYVSYDMRLAPNKEISDKYRFNGFAQNEIWVTF